MESTVEYRLKTAKTKKVKGGAALDVAFDEITTTTGGEVIIVPVTREGVKIVHPDLLRALDLLVPHLLIISETKSAKDFKKSFLENDEEVLKELDIQHTVYGVHMKEKNETQQVVLLGRKTVSNGRGYNIPLWPVTLDDDGENAYIHAELLKQKVDTFLSEVEAYLSGKFAENPQQEIPYNNVVDHPAKPAEKTALEQAMEEGANRAAAENTPATNSEKPAAGKKAANQ